MTIGENIKALRLKKGVTQEQFADKLGISYQAVSKWETNANSPDIAMLPEISEYFGVTIDALFYGEKENETSYFNDVKDDGVIRIVQMIGSEVLKEGRASEPFEIVFPDEHENYSVEVYGNIECKRLNCGGSLKCNDIVGNINSGGAIACDNITGNVCCGGAISCDNVEGNVNAGGNVSCDDIQGDVKCGRDVRCDVISCRIIECSGNIHCDNINYQK